MATEAGDAEMTHFIGAARSPRLMTCCLLHLAPAPLLRCCTTCPAAPAEDYLLHEQASDVEAAAQLVSRLRRAGFGHGTFHLDLELQRLYGYGLAQEHGGGNGNGNGVALG